MQDNSREHAPPATAFADLIRHYMWTERRPPITPNKLAAELGISRQTVVNWLSGAKPTPEMLRLLHQRTQMPIATLYAAAGYEELSAGIEAQDMIERILRMSPEEQAEVFARLDTFIEQARRGRERNDSRPKMLAGVH